jgi:hypothetical protein
MYTDGRRQSGGDRDTECGVEAGTAHRIPLHHH